MGRLQNPGFMRRSVWDPFQESMRMAIPLILQKNRLDQRKSDVDRMYEQENLKLQQEADKAKLDAASKVMTEKIKLKGDMFEDELKDKLEREKLAGTERRHSETIGVSKSRLELESQRLNKEKTDDVTTVAEALIEAKAKGDPDEIKYWEGIYKSTKGGKESPQDKRSIEERRRLEDRIGRLSGNIRSLRARVGIAADVMNPEIDPTIKQAQSELDNLLNVYRDTYGEKKFTSLGAKLKKEAKQGNELSELEKEHPANKLSEGQTAENGRFIVKSGKWVYNE